MFIIRVLLNFTDFFLQLIYKFVKRDVYISNKILSVIIHAGYDGSAHCRTKKMGE